jgi:hypothetical protein
VLVHKLDEALAAALEHMPQPAPGYVDPLAPKEVTSQPPTN